MSLKFRKITAWIAFTAVLFAAVSPAVASVLFSHRADILARVLGVPAKPDTGSHGDACPHDASVTEPHKQAGHQPEDGSEHAAHGVFCSFCLAASALVSLPTAANAVTLPLVSAAAFLPAGRVQPSAAKPTSTRHPRDPPLALR